MDLLRRFFFPISATRLIEDFPVSNTGGVFDGIRVAHSISFLLYFLFFGVLCSMLPVSMGCSFLILLLVSLTLIGLILCVLIHITYIFR
jgi:hypothetical protein